MKILKELSNSILKDLEQRNPPNRDYVYVLVKMIPKLTREDMKNNPEALQLYSFLYDICEYEEFPYIDNIDVLTDINDMFLSFSIMFAQKEISKIGVKFQENLKLMLFELRKEAFSMAMKEIPDFISDEKIKLINNENTLNTIIKNELITLAEIYNKILNDKEINIDNPEVKTLKNRIVQLRELYNILHPGTRWAPLDT